MDNWARLNLALRILAVEGAKNDFETNKSDHHHFFVEGGNKVFEIVGDGPVPGGSATALNGVVGYVSYASL